MTKKTLIDSVSIVWTTAKKYWYIIVAVLASIIYFLFFKKIDFNLTSTIKNIIDNHNSELDRIKNAEKEQDRQIILHEKEYQDAMDIIEKKYTEKQKELTVKQKTDIKELLDNSDNVKLAEELSKITGYKVIIKK